MDFAMTKITLLIANLTVAIVAITTIPDMTNTDMTNTVRNAKSARFQISIVLKPGLVMDFVMTSTTKPDVSLILVIVATITILTNTCTVTLVMNVRS